MVLSLRERVIFLGAVALLGLLALDRFVVNPATAHFKETRDRKATLALEVEAMNALLRGRPTMEERWSQMLGNGLTEDPSAAESALFHALETWSSQHRVKLASVTPQRSTTEKGLSEIAFTVAGSGSMQAVGPFLWSIEQAALPVKINSLQLGSTNSSGQELTVTLKLSMLYLAPGKAQVN